MDFEDKKPKKKLTPNQATIKAQLSCAYQERCQQEMRDKLYEWGLYSNDVENIIANLISDNFFATSVKTRVPFFSIKRPTNNTTKSDAFK